MINSLILSVFAVERSNLTLLWSAFNFYIAVMIFVLPNDNFHSKIFFIFIVRVTLMTGGILGVFSTIFMKWELNRVANFALSLTDTSSNSVEILWFLRKPLLVRNGLTAVQKLLIVSKSTLCNFPKVIHFVVFVRFLRYF